MKADNTFIIANFFIKLSSSSEPNNSLIPEYVRTIPIAEKVVIIGDVIIEIPDTKFTKIPIISLITFGTDATTIVDITVINDFLFFLFNIKTKIAGTNTKINGFTIAPSNENKLFPNPR